MSAPQNTPRSAGAGRSRPHPRRTRKRFPMDLTIDVLRVPSSLDDADGADFVAYIRVSNEQWRRDSGTDLLDEDPRSQLDRWHVTTDAEHHGIVGRIRGEIVAVAGLSFDVSTARTAETWVAAVAAHQESGVLDEMTSGIERLAAEHGRSVLQPYTTHRPTTRDEPRLAPASPAGHVLHDHLTELHLRHGYELQQVERASTFDLHGSFDAVQRLEEKALAKAGPEYRVAWWAGRTPPEYAEGYAYAIGRMSTDVPAGGLLTEQHGWTAERIARRDDRFERSGDLLGVTLVVHEPTGTIAAFNELVIGRDRSARTDQYGTLVLPEHRGRMLGSVVKCVGLRRWHEAVPSSPTVVTWNAEENAHMLSVNEAVGFRPVAYAGAWEKMLT